MILPTRSDHLPPGLLSPHTERAVGTVDVANLPDVDKNRHFFDSRGVHWSVKRCLPHSRTVFGAMPVKM